MIPPRFNYRIMTTDPRNAVVILDYCHNEALHGFSNAPHYWRKVLRRVKRARVKLNLEVAPE